MDYLEEKKIDWNIINSYFNSSNYYFTGSQIDSYNDFILNKIPYTIQTLNPFTMLKKNNNKQLIHEVNVYIGGEKGDKIYLGKPVLHYDKTTKPLYPNEARLKDLNYTTDLNVDIMIEYISYDDKGTKDVSKSSNKIIKNVNIGKIPIMLHSKLCILNNQPPEVLSEVGECRYDQGGYFIISGKEKTIISQERITTNKIFIEKTSDPYFLLNGLIRCTSEENNLFPKTTNFGIYSDEYNQGLKTNVLVLTCPNIDKTIPIFIMFRALGIESDKEILSYILYDIDSSINTKLLEFLRFSIIDSNYIFTQTEALKYLSNYVEYKDIDNLKNILSNDFLPNVGKNFNSKAYFLGYLINKIIKVQLNIEKVTNKDNYLFKRVDLSGFMLSNLFRDLYNKLRNNIRNEMDKQYNYGHWKSTGEIVGLINSNNLKNIFDPNIISENMIKSFKGNWGGTNDPSKEGVVQDLNRLSYLGYLSHVRRINTPIDRSVKLVEPHRLGNTQFGAMCPIESPDGGNIGLLKHFPIFTIVSYDIDPKEIIECCREHDLLYLSEVSPENVMNSVKVFVNNNWIGIHYTPNIFYKKLKLFKNCGIINQLVSISWYVQKHEIHIQTDAGRVLRPLYIVSNTKKHKNELLLNLSSDFKDIQNNKFNWNELIKGKLLKELDLHSSSYNKNLIHKITVDDKINYDKLRENSCIIEYVDIEETNNALIAMNRKYLENKNYKYTHCEIDPSTIFSVYTNIIPFSNHNPYPRNAFGCQQGKQAIGIYATNFNNRIDTASYIIHYPQKAIVHTKYSKYTHNDELPNGENLIVAIATYTGFNQEDSIIVNKSSIERGMFNITKFKSYINEEYKSSSGSDNIKFQNPLELVKKGVQIKFKMANWDFIDNEGIPIEGSYIDEDDIILGKVSTNTEFEENKSDEQIFSNRVKNVNYLDKSVVGSKILKGFVDKVFLYEKEKNVKKIKVRMRKTMKPELGDKMSSRHGQKGVCGMIYAQEDMPFNKDGISPDIIINPHAIPSRMTIGQLIECVLCKLGCKHAMTFDGTAFNNQSTNKLFNVLDSGKKNTDELHKYCDEILYNGFTGEQIPCHIFFGPTYYYRLKHMVSDKVNYRTTGPMTATTKQPTKGRANGGGLRIGEMETNAILGHGLGSFLKESMMERSDSYSYFIENEHGTVAMGDKDNLKSTYKNENTHDYSNVKTPYSLKLLLQEIEAFSIKPSIITDETHEFDEVYENPSIIN
jgi:DNA-directed RNA polymerase II subunit RPB2